MSLASIKNMLIALFIVALFVATSPVYAATWACETFDEVTGDCSQWVQVSFLGLPELTPEQMAQFTVAYVAFLAACAVWRQFRPIVS